MINIDGNKNVCEIDGSLHEILTEITYILAQIKEDVPSELLMPTLLSSFYVLDSKGKIRENINDVLEDFKTDSDMFFKSLKGVYEK